jgi:lysyl-tRNA synthetase class 2
LIVNNDLKSFFVKMAKIIKFLRSYLDNLDFLEVETPILNGQAGGALARPFLTHLNDLKQDLELRIAPELYLKQLIVGGFERVYEIGKVFRNEGIDASHNPEFTSLEFYMAYADYRDLITLTEDLLKKLCVELYGSDHVLIPQFDIRRDQNDDKAEEKFVELDFREPFKKYDVMTEIGVDPLLLENLPELDRQLISKIRGELLPEIYKSDKSRANKIDSEL